MFNAHVRLIGLVRVFACIVVFLGLAVRMTTAQDTDSTLALLQNQVANLTAVEFQDFAIQLPDTWLVWKRSDYSSSGAAVGAAVDLYEPVGSSYVADVNQFSWMALTAFSPELVDGQMVELRVEPWTAAEIAASIERPEDDIVLEDFLRILYGVEDTAIAVDLYGRPSFVHIFRNDQHTSIGVFTVFPERELFTLTDLIMPNRFFDTLPTIAMMMATSLRPSGEEFDPNVGLAALEQVIATAESMIECELTTSNSINLREGPGTNFAIAQAATGGLRADGIGQAIGSDGIIWWKLPNNMWVRSDVVTETGNCDALPVVEGSAEGSQTEAADEPLINILMRGGSLLETGEYDAALEAFNTVLERDPENVMAFYGVGDVHYVRDDCVPAVYAYQSALELEPPEIQLINPAAPLANYKIGNCMMRVGIYTAAVASFNRAEELGFEPENFLYDRALALTYMGDLDPALDDLNALIALVPDHGNAYVLRFRIFTTIGDNERGLDDLNRAIELYPQNAEALFYRGSLLMQLGDPEGAMADLSKAIELQPEVADGYIVRSRVRRALDDLEGALLDLSTAIELQPSNASSFLSRATLLTELGEREQAVPDYWQWVQLTSVDFASHESLAAGESLTVEMREGGQHSIPLAGREGDVITITADSATGTDLDPLLILLDPLRRPIAADDDSGQAGHALIDSFTLPADGRYTIILTHAGGETDGDVVVTVEVEDAS
jgi:tetratricopeptide (TPR) repeat protein